MDEVRLQWAYERHHRDGLSIRELVDEMWQDLGYKNPVSCRSALQSALRVRGMKLRDRSEAMWRHHGANGTKPLRPVLRRVVEGREAFGSPRYIAAVLAMRNAEMEDAQRNPELAALIAEQKKDESIYQIGKPWMLSLNAPIGVSDDALGDFIDQTGSLHFGQRFTPDFTALVDAIMDRRREIDAWADAA